MPMSIEFDEKALRTLASPPRPSEPLRDIVLAMGKSNDINALAMMGRSVLRSCVGARKFQPPIPSGFNLEVDAIVIDHRLAKIAEATGLLERLNVDGVATKPVDVAQILCAYVGSSFTQSYKQQGINAFHHSINDICSALLDDDIDEDPATENNTTDKMRNIPGVMQMPQIKPESSPNPFPSTKGPIPDAFGRDDESVSSGPTPVPGPSFAQPQPHYPTPPPTIIQPQPQSQPTSRGGYGEYPGMGMPQNPPGYGMPAQMPLPPPPATAQQSQGFISLFNELAMKNRMAISWQQHKSGQQHIPEWTMWLMVDGQPKGYGTASTKQSAKEIAAKTALQAMGWLNS